MNAGNGLGMRTGAVLSRMDTVIGRCVGNSLEVMESLEALKGNGPDDLMDLVTTLGTNTPSQTQRRSGPTSFYSETFSHKKHKKKYQTRCEKNPKVSSL